MVSNQFGCFGHCDQIWLLQWNRTNRSRHWLADMRCDKYDCGNVECYCLQVCRFCNMERFRETGGIVWRPACQRANVKWCVVPNSECWGEKIIRAAAGSIHGNSLFIFYSVFLVFLRQGFFVPGTHCSVAHSVDQANLEFWDAGTKVLSHQLCFCVCLVWVFWGKEGCLLVWGFGFQPRLVSNLESSASVS